MDCSNLLKILFEDTDDDYIRELEEKLKEKEKNIAKMKQKEEQLGIGVSIAKMELYTLTRIFEEVKYHVEYQRELESKIPQLLEATLKLGHILDHVEWHKIKAYDELMNAEAQRENGRMNEEMQTVYDAMEDRDIVKKFRHEQERKAKLQALWETANKLIAKKNQDSQSKFDAAIQKRNSVIVELVAGSKKLKELHLQRMLKKSTVDEGAIGVQTEAIQQIINPTSSSSSKVIFSGIEKPVERLFEEPLVGNDLEPKNPTETIFKPTKSSLNIRFNTFDFTKFHFEKFEVQQRAIDDSLVTESIKPLRSILRNPLKNSLDNVSNQSKKEKHVRFVTPQHSESSSEEEILSLSASSIPKSNIEKKVKASSFESIDINASEPIEVDILDIFEMQGGDESWIEAIVSPQHSESSSEEEISSLATSSIPKSNIEKKVKASSFESIDINASEPIEVDIFEMQGGDESWIEAIGSPMFPDDVQELVKNTKTSLDSDESMKRSINLFEKLSIEENTSHDITKQILKPKQPLINKNNSSEELNTIEMNSFFMDLMNSNPRRTSVDSSELNFSDGQKEFVFYDVGSHKSFNSDNLTSGTDFYL